MKKNRSILSVCRLQLRTSCLNDGLHQAQCPVICLLLLPRLFLSTATEWLVCRVDLVSIWLFLHFRFQAFERVLFLTSSKSLHLINGFSLCPLQNFPQRVTLGTNLGIWDIRGSGQGETRKWNRREGKGRKLREGKKEGKGGEERREELWKGRDRQRQIVQVSQSSMTLILALRFTMNIVVAKE